MQMAIAATYIVLNLSYWAVSIFFDSQRFWDLDAWYDVSREDPVCVRNDIEQRPRSWSTLWSVILETGQIDWVKDAPIISSIPMVQEWLREARENITNREWDAVAAGDRAAAAVRARCSQGSWK
jgi:hypothetical protein